MKRLFEIDSPLYRWLMNLANWMILNFCFLIGSIFIVTIGASLTALYSVALKLAKDHIPSIWSEFWLAYKNNFKQATLIWMGCLLFAGMIIFNIYIFGNSGSSFFDAYQIMMLILFVVLIIITVFIFPVLAKFDNTITETFQNTFMFIIKNFSTSILVILTVISVILITFYNTFTLAWAIGIYLSFGFGLLAVILSKYFNVIFDKYINNKNIESEDSNG